MQKQSAMRGPREAIGPLPATLSDLKAGLARLARDPLGRWVVGAAAVGIAMRLTIPSKGLRPMRPPEATDKPAADKPADT